MTCAAPHSFVVLGLDQAAVSGWAVWAHGRIVAHGVARTWEERMHAIQCAMEHANMDATRLLVVFEDHSGITLTKGTRLEGKPTRNTAAILGMGAARGRWEEALDRAGHSEARRLHVLPKHWRARVLGLGPAARTEVCKAKALEWASGTLFKALTDHNEAEAVCIASWGGLDGVAAWEAKRTRRRVEERARRTARKQKAFNFGG